MLRAMTALTLYHVRRKAVVGWAVWFGAFFFGCGHPATKAECEEILDKVIELQVRTRKISDPGEVERVKKETRESRGEELLPRCVNRRISDAAMQCIRAAERVEQINDVCLR